MSTDDRMDNRLRQAGERWRDTHAEPAAVDMAAAVETNAGEATPPLLPITPLVADVRRPRPHRVRLWLASTAGVAAAVAASVLVVSVRSDRPANRPALERTGSAALVNTEWTLTQLRAAGGTALNVIEPAPLTFGKDTIGGTDGCNHLGGKVAIHAGQLVISDLATTEMACIGRADGFDAEVALIHAVLNGTVQWSIGGERLTLSKPGAGTLVYGRVGHTTTTDPKALVGLNWQLMTLVHGSGPDGTASTPAAPASVRFEADGKVTGNDGCNAMFGNAAVGNAQISFAGLGGTAKLCSGGTGEQEKLVLSVLDGTVAWSIKDGQLTITKAGRGALVFTAQASPSPGGASGSSGPR